MRKTLEKILNKDYNHEIPDKERSIEFANAYKEIVEKQIQSYNYELVNFSPNWCECSGFITDGQYYVYFNSGDYRFSDIYEDVLIRTAKSDHDYSGGMNNRCTLETIGKTANKLIEREMNK